MQISISILIVGALQLLLLIAAVYVIIFLQLRYSIRLSMADILLLALQVFNLVVLLQHITGYEGGTSAAGRNFALLYAVQGMVIFLHLIRFAWLMRKVRTLRHELLMPQSIRETIDYLPGGICFSTPNGRPILTNRRMNELVYRLTGHTVMNACVTWDELRQFISANGCTKLEELRMNREPIGGAVDDCMFFSFPGGNIWRFRKEELTDRVPRYIQLEATEISDLYHYSKKLYHNNQRLAEQYKRQQNLLANIVEINHEKEILQAKIRIHDDLGRSILTTKQHLSGQTLSENIPYLADIWNNTIRNLAEFTRASADMEISPEIELQKAADMIGCHIHFRGDRQVGRKTALLFYAVVREALTNAVRHAKADQLDVSIRKTAGGYYVEISDNGTVPVSLVTEGNGLSNLRRRLEQEGATLEIKCEDGVVLSAVIPA